MTAAAAAVVPTRIATERINHLSSSSLNSLLRTRGEAVCFVQRRWRFASCCMTKKKKNTASAWTLQEGGADVDTTTTSTSTSSSKVVLVRPATEAYAQEAVQALRAGHVIAVPTDTLYGFACDACLHGTYCSSKEAVNRIYEIKGREHTKPLAICVGDTTDIERFAVTDHLPPSLLDSLLPGPVTVVLKRGESSILEKSLNPNVDSIGVRVPDCNFIRIIARVSKSALALTSANFSGMPSSVCITDFEDLWEHCAYVYDGGVLPSGRAGSTVVGLTKPGKYKIIRAGSAKEGTLAILARYSLIEDREAD